MLKVVVQSPWETSQDARTGPGKGGEPEWWPSRLFPDWHAWTGVAGMLYARWVRSSPPVVARARTPAGLIEDARRAITARQRKAA